MELKYWGILKFNEKNQMGTGKTEAQTIFLNPFVHRANGSL
jgi:hypothetical protein